MKQKDVLRWMLTETQDIYREIKWQQYVLGEMKHSLQQASPGAQETDNSVASEGHETDQIHYALLLKHAWE